jgi:hypothetical protein
MVIHAGNYEILGIRDRASQTLYVSDVITVDACDYGKLHTGLFIAALRDANNRARRLHCCNPRPQSWTEQYDNGVKTSSAGIVTEVITRTVHIEYKFDSITEIHFE